MSKKSKQRAEAKDAAKAAARRAIEQQYPELRPGQLEPKPLAHHGRFSFTSRREAKAFVTSMRRDSQREPLPKPKPPGLKLDVE